MKINPTILQCDIENAKAARDYLKKALGDEHYNSLVDVMSAQLKIAALNLHDTSSGPDETNWFDLAFGLNQLDPIKKFTEAALLTAALYLDKELKSQ